MNLQVNGHKSMADQTTEESTYGNNHQGTNEEKQGLKNKLKTFFKNKRKRSYGVMFVLALVLSIVHIILCAIFCIPKGDIKPHSSQCTCPDEWIFYRKKCYFFSKEEKDWNSSRHICLTQHAALTGIDDQIEMVFLLKHKCTGDHWIGLEIKNTTEKPWYNVSGNEGCGYLHENGVATARCYTERKWICEKNVHNITISNV